MKNGFLALSVLTLVTASFSLPAFCQAQNDFFGGSLPSSVPSASNPPATAGGAPGAADYTDDEKRMQKKYKFSLQHAKELMSKGEAMMKKGEARHNDKMYKKGKILKEIADKRLNELQANNPFSDAKSPEDKKSAGL